MDIFLKEPMLDKKGEKEKRSSTKEAVQGTNTSKDWDLLMTLSYFMCGKYDMFNSTLDECQLHI